MSLSPLIDLRFMDDHSLTDSRNLRLDDRSRYLLNYRHVVHDRHVRCSQLSMTVSNRCCLDIGTMNHWSCTVDDGLGGMVGLILGERNGSSGGVGSGYSGKLFWLCDSGRDREVSSIIL